MGHACGMDCSVNVTVNAQVALQGVLERARQLNACVAYGGVSPTALMEDDHVRVLLSLLPSTSPRPNGAIPKQLGIGAGGAPPCLLPHAHQCLRVPMHTLWVVMV